MNQLKDFLTHLLIERGLSSNSYDAYRRDLTSYQGHLSNRGISSFSSATRHDIHEFIASLRNRGLAPSSIARHLSAIRIFHRFLIGEGLATIDPTEHIRTPKQPRRLPVVLNRQEVDLSLIHICRCRRAI